MNNMLREAARKLQEAEITIDEFLELVKSSLDGIELPEKDALSKEEGDSDWFYSYGRNQAITEVQTVLDKYKKGL